MRCPTRIRRPRCGWPYSAAETWGAPWPKSSSPAPTTWPPEPGIRLELVGIAVADPGKPRPDAVDRSLIGTDAAALVERDDVDVVVELIGGLHPAHELVESALRRGKPVVTGNKALLATAGAELAQVAADAGVDLLYEAAVAGAIPVIRPLRESLAGEQILRVMGIVNGTTNYILTRMEEDGDSYDDVLREAQELGLAERDPTADVEGHDAAAKAAILASLAFGSDVVDSDVHREGISTISAADVAYARKLGYSVKLLAVAELVQRRPGDIGSGPSGHGAEDAPAGLGPWRLQRGLRGGSREWRADAVRARRRRRTDGQRDAGRPCRRLAQLARRRSCTGTQTHQRHGARSERHARRVLPRAWTWPTDPGCWPPWPRSSETTTCPSAPWSKWAWPRRPASSS